MIEKILKEFYSNEGPERIGFIVENEIIEVENMCTVPNEGFQVSTHDILKYANVAKATWHTHPGAGSNLSQDDYVAFKNWPNLKHFIVGNDGVRCFYYDQSKRTILEYDIQSGADLGW